MPDYIYLLESRLSPAQRHALRAVREVARQKAQTVFLVGGAVRDLTSGSPVRDLDVVVQGNALKLKKELVAAGAAVTGEYEPGQSLHLLFPGSVRMEFASTLGVSYPKPGKPVYKAAPILEDLRRRDFTANAMALSLNEGSYGLLMDPLNGVADIENRQLRLVSNYGFIEDPVRMVRAVRLMSRLGWTLEEKTQGRYETGKQEGYISVLSDYLRGYETEEIVHEEDPLRVLRGLEAEGWMKVLAPFWTVAKTNVAELERLRDLQTQLQMQGMTPDTASAQFPLLTAKLSPKEVATLKASFPRPGFVAQIDALDVEAREFSAQITGEAAVLPSQAWRMLSGARPEVVLWTVFTTKSAALQTRFQAFLKDWPQARQRMPYVMMQEMRITPDLPGYEALLESLFFELMDGKLGTPEEMKAFLEPHSPPAPPPPVNLRRPRAAKKEAKPSKSRSKKAAPAGEMDETASEPAAESTESNLTDEPSAPVKTASSTRFPSTSVPATAGKAAEVMKAERVQTTAPPVAAAKPAVAKGAGAKGTAPAKSASAAGKATAAKATAAKATGAKASGAKASGEMKSAASKTASGKIAPARPLAKKTAVKTVDVARPKPVAQKPAAQKPVSALQSTQPAPKKAATAVVAKKAVAKPGPVNVSAKAAGKAVAAKSPAKGSAAKAAPARSGTGSAPPVKAKAVPARRR